MGEVGEVGSFITRVSLSRVWVQGERSERAPRARLLWFAEITKYPN